MAVSVPQQHVRPMSTDNEEPPYRTGEIAYTADRGQEKEAVWCDALCVLYR